MKNYFLLLFSLTASALVSAQSIPLPYSTGFDTPSEKAGWVEYRTGVITTYHWSYGAVGFSGSTGVSHDYNVGANPNDTMIDWFVSPPLVFTTQNTFALKLKTSGFSTPLPDNFEVLFGSNQQDPSLGNFIVVANLSAMLPQDQWLDTVFNINIAADSGYIALKYKTIGPAWTTYVFDNIVITPIPMSSKNHVQNAMKMNCYPNPFTNQMQVNVEHHLNHARLIVFNSLGQEIKTMENINGKSFTMNRENLNGGIYFMKLMEGERSMGLQKLLIFD